MNRIRKKIQTCATIFSHKWFNFAATKYKKNFDSDSLNAGSAISGADEVP